MGLLSWIILGLIAGVIADFLMGGGVGLLGSIILGIVGAVVGGWLASQLGFGSLTGLNIGSIVIAVVGACIVLFVILGRRNHHETGSFVEATLKVAAPFLIALAVGWVVARGWRNPTGLGTVAVVWVVTIALGMVLRNLVFDRGTASAFVIVAAVVTFVLLFGWRLLYNKVLARTS
jgi:uncharacterized membrane protein YeaQ/YmgE (transglycosylase-associated protein family)